MFTSGVTAHTSHGSVRTLLWGSRFSMGLVQREKKCKHVKYKLFFIYFEQISIDRKIKKKHLLFKKKKKK